MGFFSSITGALGGLAKTATGILNPISSVINAASPITSAYSQYTGDKYQADAIRDTNAANLKYLQDANASNLQLQKDFAQQGLSWKIQDAKNAGISPLAALGANVSAPSIGVMAHQDTVAPRSSKAAALGASALLSAQIKKEDAMANYYNSQAIATAKQASDIAKERQGAITMPYGWEKFIPGQSSPQERMENEYGGAVGEIYGIGRFIDDLNTNLKRRVDKIDPAKQKAWEKSYTDSLYRNYY